MDFIPKGGRKFDQRISPMIIFKGVYSNRTNVGFFYIYHPWKTHLSYYCLLSRSYPFSLGFWLQNC